MRFFLTPLQLMQIGELRRKKVKAKSIFACTNGLGKVLPEISNCGGDTSGGIADIKYWCGPQAFTRDGLPLIHLVPPETDWYLPVSVNMITAFPVLSSTGVLVKEYFPVSIVCKSALLLCTQSLCGCPIFSRGKTKRQLPEQDRPGISQIPQSAGMPGRTPVPEGKVNSGQAFVFEVMKPGDEAK